MAVLLYHLPNAICAQKVRVVLAEKGVPFSAENVVNRLRDPEYLKLNPNGYVPTLVHDGKVLWESRIIAEYIDDAFEGPPLLSEDPFERAQTSIWTKQIDDSLHLNVFILSLTAIFRDVFLARPEGEREKFLAFDLTKRERTKAILKDGWDSHYVDEAVKRFAKLTADMEDALQNGPWLVGSSYSLADADFTPYLHRLTDLGLSRLWKTKPALAAWFDRVRSRNSFDEVYKNWYTEEEVAAADRIRVAAEPKFGAVLDRLGLD
ncbi:MAG: hypothetical protein DI569_01410 [Sphingopyxis macrogoltabida]|uniref:Glutathione S-transferase n=1 Tax=Sphingopyxis macrogoltabida TaxID=33050 RepID=A0A2W5L5N1_SPHMC|nr:MAG: hypothetical protein DI569_01410 [Sphingopyxis macrogoltabida]